jgi:serine-protein kinase ATM
VKDKGFHKIFETLFRLASTEKSAYGKAKTDKTISTAVNRLSDVAHAFRLVVGLAIEGGLQRLRLRTVRAVIEHISQILQVDGRGGFCEPLSVDYLKTLKSILEYQSNAEHLLKGEWMSLVKFCIDGLLYYDGDQTSSIRHTSKGAQLRSVSISRYRQSSSTSQSTRVSAEDSRRITSELVLVLQQLTSASNAHLTSKAESIVPSMLGYLSRSPIYGTTNSAAFATLNNILSKISSDSISLTFHIIEEVLPIISRSWTTNSPVLKDEMLITVIHCQAHIKSLSLSGDETSNIRSHLETLLEAFQSEYTRRLEGKQLQLEDISYFDPLSRPDPASPLRTRSMKLRDGSQRAEQSWMILHSIAFMIHCLDSTTEVNNRNIVEDVGDGPSKRQRKSNIFDDLLREPRSGSIASRIMALQIIPFYLDLRGVDGHNPEQVSDLLFHNISDDNSTIASWAMVDLAWYLFLRRGEKLRKLTSDLLAARAKLRDFRLLSPNGLKSGR